MESGSSNDTTAVLEKGSTSSISGDDGTSAIECQKKNILKTSSAAKIPVK